MVSDPVPLVLLHGLLGDAEDWRPVIQALAGIECHALDLPGHGRNQAVRVSGFDEAHRWLCDELATRDITHYRLVGYSLGGRLALHHASLSPTGLQALLLENCHPGLPEAERAARLVHDELWASRFEHEPLPRVLADWYRQPVFADLDEEARARQAARRLGNQGPAVAAMLRATSLGRQPDLAPCSGDPAAGALGLRQPGSQIPCPRLPVGKARLQYQTLGSGWRAQPARRPARYLCPAPAGVGQPTRREDP